MIDLYFDYQRRTVYRVPDTLQLEKNSYQIGERISNGGNAVVHKCIDPLGDEYAVKFMLPRKPVFCRKSK